jgi:hypothetical protein
MTPSARFRPRPQSALVCISFRPSSVRRVDILFSGPSPSFAFYQRDTRITAALCVHSSYARKTECKWCIVFARWPFVPVFFSSSTIQFRTRDLSDKVDTRWVAQTQVASSSFSKSYLRTTMISSRLHRARLPQLLQTVHSRYQNRYRNRVTNSTRAFSYSLLK